MTLRKLTFGVAAAGLFVLASSLPASAQDAGAPPASPDQQSPQAMDQPAPDAQPTPDAPASACDPNADSCASAPPADSGMVGNLHPTAPTPTTTACNPAVTTCPPN
jgi:hypothetical protein